MGVDNDIDFRYERKYTINGLSLHDCKRVIRRNELCFSEVYEARFVNNIYFDTVDLKNWEDNVEGNPKRIKARIRWYGDLFGCTYSPVLEFKIKDGFLGYKRSFPLTNFVLDESITKQKLDEVFMKSNLDGKVYNYVLMLEPTLVNRYKRNYYLSENKNYRLTLDRDLIYYKIKPNRNKFNREIKDIDENIIEIKYDKDKDSDLRRITKILPFRMTKKSKYVTGIYLTDY